MNSAAPETAGLSPAQPLAGLMLGAAVALLLLGVFAFDRANRIHVQAGRALDGAKVALIDAHARAQVAQHNRLLLAAATTLSQHAQRSSVMPRYWGERQINLRQQNMPRDQINSLLQSTARNNMQLLTPEDFELSVTQADEGLFDVAPGSRQPVLLTLRGSIYFRISERPL